MQIPAGVVELSNASAKTERENNGPLHREPLKGSCDQVLIGLVTIFIGQTQ